MQKTVNGIDKYYKDKSWGTGGTRCIVYNKYYDTSQDWPRFLTAYRDDRRGATTGAYKKDMLGLYFSYAKRSYANYVEAMGTLLADLRELCEEN